MDMSALALQETALKTLSDLVAAELKTVRDAMQAALDESGASRVDARLPDGTKVGTISMSDPKPTARVVDDAAFLAWVREHSPANVVTRLVTEVRPAYVTALLAEMTAAGVAEVADRETGVVWSVPGVEVRATRSRTHSARLADGGGEAVIRAWRAGALAHLPLPQLGTAGE